MTKIDGVAMGSPLAPVLANLFMGHHEKIWLEQYQGPELLFYRRYVDDTFCLFHSEQDAIAFFDYINSQHPNIRFTMEKEIDHVLPFLDILIDNTHRSSVVTSTFRKKTITGLLTNYFSFTPLSYKIGFIRTLIERVFKINNTWLGFHKDIAKLVFILRKNIFPAHLINKCVYRYLNTAMDRYGSTPTPPSSTESLHRVNNTFYKLPYLGCFSTVVQSKIRRFVNRFCNDLSIKLVFTTFKLRNLFSVKDSVPRELRPRVSYKFSCACCNACYIGETGRHFPIRVREHLSSDKSSHIFKHLLSSDRCRQSCSTDGFEILDSAPTKFQLKLKEAMHINWEKPNLDQQVHHVNLTLTL